MSIIDKPLSKVYRFGKILLVCCKVGGQPFGPKSAVRQVYLQFRKEVWYFCKYGKVLGYKCKNPKIIIINCDAEYLPASTQPNPRIQTDNYASIPRKIIHPRALLSSSSPPPPHKYRDFHYSTRGFLPLTPLSESPTSDIRLAAIISSETGMRTFPHLSRIIVLLVASTFRTLPRRRSTRITFPQTLLISPHPLPLLRS